MISENAVRLSVKEGAKIFSEEPIPRQARDALEKGIKLAEAAFGAENHVFGMDFQAKSRQFLAFFMFFSWVSRANRMSRAARRVSSWPRTRGSARRQS